ncbi:OmpA family protein [Rhodobacterales bacterium HKCCE2091]|nr:OmpA family protein [Rhodobacterales bacterium HKCCE2091]
MLRAGAVLLCLAGPGLADEVLSLPETAEAVVTETEPYGRSLIPTGPWAGGGMPSFEAEGAIRREVWRIADSQAATGVLLAVLTGQLEEAGFAPIFSCTTRVCGGFDFRYGLDLVPEPEMHVNLADFAFHAARRDGPEGPEYIALVISTGGGEGYVQVTHVAPETAAFPDPTVSSRAPDAAPEAEPVPLPGTPDSRTGAADLASALSSIGRAPLPGVTFAYGATALADPDLPILQELADYLGANPDVRLTLVGHTDAEGALQSNIAVSRARAAAVRQVLIDRYGIAPARLTAEGVGYLMPLAPNTTQEGRDVNRRVEAVVINTE